MAFSLVLHGTVPKDEICGVIVGHGELAPLREGGEGTEGND